MGYDASLVNGLQLVKAWRVQFHSPRGEMLGIITSAQTIGGVRRGPPFRTLVHRQVWSASTAIWWCAHSPPYGPAPCSPLLLRPASTTRTAARYSLSRRLLLLA